MLFVSVDFDFFPARLEDQTYELPALGETQPGEILFDWGAGEAGPVAAMQEFLWYERAAHFEACGLNLEREFAIRPDVGSVALEDFSRHVLEDLTEDLCLPIHWADSHMFAYAVLEGTWARSGIHVVNFDAHHDLGYVADRVIKGLMSGSGSEVRVSCEDWALAALSYLGVESYTVVYPDWQGMREWPDEEMGAGPWTAHRRSQIHAMTWSEWIGGEWKRFAGEAVSGFVARSGSWTPPYLDGEFQRLLGLLSGDDPAHVPQLPPDHPYDLPREWSPEKIAELVEQKEQVFAQLRAAKD